MPWIRWSAGVALLVAVQGGGVRLSAAPTLPPQQTSTSNSQTADPSTHQAPVVIDGEEIFRVRGISVYPAERRAAEMAAAVRRLAADPLVTESSLTLSPQSDVTWLLANGKRVLGVYDEDAALEAIDRQVLAEAYRARIWNVVVAYRAARQPALLWRNALRTLAATFLLVLTAWFGRRIVRSVRAGLERRYEARIRDFQIRSFRLLRAEQLWLGLTGFLNLVWGLSVVALTFVYLEYTLGLFPWTRGTAHGLLALTMQPLRTVGVDLLRAIPNLLFLFVLFYITRYVLRLIHLFFGSVARGAVSLRNFDADWAWPTYRLVRLGLIALAVVIAYPYVPGSDTDAFKGVTIFAGVVFSLGSSSFIGNVIAGYSLTFRRAFRVGDRVRIGEHLGDVTDIRLMVTHVRTPWNEEVVVPNSQIVSAEIVNYSRWASDRGLILKANVRIGYGTPWRQVEAMLREAARRTPGVLTEPPAFVNQTELGEFAVLYELNAYCNTPLLMRELYTELHRHILDVFNEFGVQIMTPAYEGDPEAKKIVPPERWREPPASQES